ncbi:transglutaminase family protein [Methylophilus aquaticus]|uniref:Transglutaminase family protein n=1 Tax=Methylophilus aquaticus TaxID=1971610 RepID=A0ABT9JNU1_9PROT|nr:transglutaminase family protein [Methylophilus aquaticus]MDP8566265.1 transglutaminase family protein [Methylophilus aquaticus]
MLLNIEHQTQYVYSDVVQYTIQQLRLTPRNGMGQHVKQWEIKVNGQLHAFEDTFGNTTHTLVIDQPHQELLISVSGEVETGVSGLEAHQPLPLAIYLRDTPLTQADAAITAFAKHYAKAPVAELMLALRDRMQYIKGATQVDTTAAEAFRLGQGVCQDHTHIFIACCHSLGLPARYVSGYLFTPDGSLMQTHAWVDVWQTDHWLGLDVSNGTLVDEMHVRLATGLDYRSASPVTGSRMGGGAEGMSSMVSVNQSAGLSYEQRKANMQALYQQAKTAQQQ